jgi:FkbH-like protein
MQLTLKELKRLAKQPIEGIAHRVALLGDTATQLLATAIKGYATYLGYPINLYEAEYNQVVRQFLDTTSELYAFQPEYIIVFQSTHKWNEYYSLIPPERYASLADERMNFIRQICGMTNAKVIYLNYAEIEDTVFGSYANRVESSFSYQVRKANYLLMQLSQQVDNLFICDIAGLQNKYGRNFMFDATIYTSTEMILSVDAIPMVAKRIMDMLTAFAGQFHKCLILDLDNTLWGGVIGDDGLEGIQLGHGLGIGKAFTELQMWIKKLRQRGIIICVCSKNDENKAKEPFEKHPDMILHLDDIAVFMANWDTKVDNIRSIQQVLNIDFDSMVFLDDSPFERNIVRENIPGICVPDLPDDPAEYLEFLYSQNFFETVNYSTLDKDRTKQYQVQAERSTFAKIFDNEDDFLKSLNMVSVVQGFTKFNTPRVAQLSQRSNQFNLRTVRYTESDIDQMAKNPKVLPITFTLEDKFGDNGLICVIICTEQTPGTLFIDTWFMSCRVLKRGMEYFTLNTIVAFAKEKGYKRIVGEYLPTHKNNMVKDHYINLGFKKIKEASTNQFELDVDNYQEKGCYITRK